MRLLAVQSALHGRTRDPQRFAQFKCGKPLGRAGGPCPFHLSLRHRPRPQPPLQNSAVTLAQPTLACRDRHASASGIACRSLRGCRTYATRVLAHRPAPLSSLLMAISETALEASTSVLPRFLEYVTQYYGVPKPQARLVVAERRNIVLQQGPPIDAFGP